MSDADNKTSNHIEESLKRARDALARCLETIASHERDLAGTGRRAEATLRDLQAKTSELGADLLEKHRKRLISKRLATRESISITRSAINSVRRDILYTEQDRDREEKRIRWLIDDQVRIRDSLMDDIRLLESRQPFTPAPPSD